MTHANTNLIDRRKALACVAVVPAAVALGAGTALASVGEDAELRHLWEEWKAQFAHCGEANHVFGDVEGKVFDDTAPRWEWIGGMGLNLTPEAPYSASFRSYRRNEPSELTVPLIGAKGMEDAYAMAKAKQAELSLDHERTKKAAKRRHKWAAAKRADGLARKQLNEIQEKIADTPAEGLNGILIKLAVWSFWNHDEVHSNEHNVLLSAYEAVVKQTGGVDLAAQVKRW